MTDVRTTNKYKKNLSKGIVNASLRCKKDTYTLSALLPPITDYVYNPITDTWCRKGKQPSEHVMIEEHNLLVTDKWYNYGFSLKKQKPKKQRKNAFRVDSNGYKYLEIEPLEVTDTTCYIKKVYNNDILSTIFGSLFVSLDEQDIVDNVTYMRLRCVCKKFRDIIDNSPNLLEHRRCVVKEVVERDNDVELTEHIPEEIQRWITIYQTPDMDYYDIYRQKYVDLLCDSLDLCRKHCSLRQYAAFSYDILKMSEQRRSFPISFIRVFNKLCIESRKVNKMITIDFLNNYNISILFLLVKGESKIIKTRTIQGKVHCYDVTHRYKLRTREEIDNCVLKCIQRERETIFPY